MILDGGIPGVMVMANTDIFSFIEGFNNPWRRHSTLGYLSHDEFEHTYFVKSAI